MWKGVRLQAERDFAEHELTLVASVPERDFEAWKFAKPGTNILSIHVMGVDRRIVLTGDCDDLVIKPYHEKPLRWLWSHVDNQHYFMSKMDPAKVSQFDPKYAGYIIGELEAGRWHWCEPEEEKEIASQFMDQFRKRFFHDEVELMDEGPVGEMAWWEMWQDCEAEVDGPPGARFTKPQVRFQVEALRMFSLAIRKHLGIEEEFNAAAV